MHIMHIDMTMYDRLTVETLKEEEILWNLHCYFTYPLCSIFSLAVKRPFVVKKKKKSDYYRQVCQENSFTKCLQMQLAKLTVSF